MKQGTKTILDVSGMSRDEIFDCLVVCMRDRGLYEESLDPAIMVLSGLIETYQKAYDNFVNDMTHEEFSRENNSRTVLNPTFAVISTLGEQIRKYMRDLGLVVAKPAGFVSQEKETCVPNQGDKLTTMLGMVAQPRIAVYKKNKKAAE